MKRTTIIGMNSNNVSNATNMNNNKQAGIDCDDMNINININMNPHDENNSNSNNNLDDSSLLFFANGIPTSPSMLMSASTSTSTTTSANIINNTNTNNNTNNNAIALCASCDRCRARKTKCDGQRPCANCKTKYMKKHKLRSIEDVPLSNFECIYSPAKRRGPVPGRVGQARKAAAAAAAVTVGGKPIPTPATTISASATSDLDTTSNTHEPNSDTEPTATATNMTGKPKPTPSPTNDKIMVSPKEDQQQQQRSNDNNGNLDFDNMMLFQQTAEGNFQHQSNNNGEAGNSSTVIPNDHGYHHSISTTPATTTTTSRSSSSTHTPTETLGNNYNNNTAPMMMMGTSDLNSGIEGLMGVGQLSLMEGLVQQQQQHHKQQQRAAAIISQNQTHQQLQNQTQTQSMNRVAPETSSTSQYLPGTIPPSHNHTAHHVNNNNRNKRRGGTGDFESSSASSSSKVMPTSKPRNSKNTATTTTNNADMVTTHKNLLSNSSIKGNKLRSYFTLSIDELFTLPPTPTDHDYARSLNTTPDLLPPKSHQTALNAARFAALALGAIVHNEISLSMELCQATVQSLRQACTAQPIQPPYEYEIAKTYFLLGCFRALRGDMVRYFKYRRVCLTHISKFEDQHANGTDFLLAAMSYMDSWAYMIYDGSEEQVPNIDGSIPQVRATGAGITATPIMNEVCTKYGVGCGHRGIASDPKNQNWIQGAPPVYLNNEAPLTSRSLDALACAIRSCCDQANSRFHAMSKAAAADSNGGVVVDDSVLAGSSSVPSAPNCLLTATTTAVMAHQDELCSRNMVVSASTLLRQYEAVNGGQVGRDAGKNQGHHLIVSALDAFLDNGNEDESGGFTDAQVQSLLSVCNTAIENPLLLYHAGPTYHMVSNSAILLCHLLNGMYATTTMASAMKNSPATSATLGAEVQSQMFDEILDTFLSVRKLLNTHRRKLPVKLRCHGIPRPSLHGPLSQNPFVSGGSALNGSDNPATSSSYVDLGETLMCACRGCQGFVLMACSPCVAAERAKKAQEQRQLEAAREAVRGFGEGLDMSHTGGDIGYIENSDDDDMSDLDRAMVDLENEFDLDDDALLNYLSGAIN